MTRRPSTLTDRYSNVAIAFHWTIAALVLANLAIGLLHDTLLPGTMSLHKSFGITVLVLTVGRIAWRLGHRPPPLAADTPGWQRGLAHATHWGLYALLLAMPLTGWAMSSGAVRRPLMWFGLVDVPYLPIAAGTAKSAGGLHGNFGWLMLALVALHIAAALYHHLVVRDRVLARMAPVLDR